jgi:hypothetical protein
MRRKVGEAVDKVVEPGEVIREAVYLHTYGSPTSSIMSGGLPTNIDTWILSVTDRRVLLLRGDSMNAANSKLIAGYPRAEVRAQPSGRGGKLTYLTVSFGADPSRRFAVPNIWRRNAAALVDELAG